MLPKTRASLPPSACEPLTNQEELSPRRPERSEWTQPEAPAPLLPLGRRRFTRLPPPLTYALPVPTPSPPRDYPCRRTLAHSSQAVHMPCLLIFMHGGSQVRGSRQSIFDSELEDSLFKDSVQVSSLLIIKFHVLCCCLIDNCNMLRMKFNPCLS